MRALASVIVRERIWMLLAWVVLAGLLLPQAGKVADRLPVGAAAMDHSDAERVEDLIIHSFGTPFGQTLVLVVTGVPGPDQDAGIDIVVDLVDLLRDAPDVRGVLSYLNGADPMFQTRGGTFLIVGLSPVERSDEQVNRLRELTQPVEANLRRSYPQADLSWTGDAAFDYDIRRTSNRDAAAAERRIMPLVGVLLLVVFGSVVASLLPALVGGLGVALSLGAAVVIADYWPMTVLLQNIVTMIGLGIGIDYCLLMVSRFREELGAGFDPERAAVRSLRSAGLTVLFSGSTVAIGFAGLLAVPATELRSIATGGLMVVVLTTALATLLLPGLLAWLGHRINALRIPFGSLSGSPSSRWHRWGTWVIAHPRAVLLTFGVPLLLLAGQARLASTDIPSGNWLPPDNESTQGALALQRLGRSGLIQTIRILVVFPSGIEAQSPQGWQTVLDIGNRLEGDDRVSRVVSLPRILGISSAKEGQRAIVDQRLLDSYVSLDGRMALLEVVPAEGVSAGDLTRYVRELREQLPRPADAELLVGGLPAANADYQDAIGGSLTQVIGFVLSGSLLMLFLAFRSALLAVKALVLNVLSVCGAMGLAVLVFQQGWGTDWMGIAEPLDGLFPAVPLIVFCVVFGLSMDYEVFLLARVAELRNQGLSNDAATIGALARTGRVITSAALVMIVVFAGFSLGDFLVIKILGFTLAAAVLLDATAVRMAIGPALLKLGARWNWWPGNPG